MSAQSDITVLMPRNHTSWACPRACDGPMPFPTCPCAGGKGTRVLSLSGGGLGGVRPPSEGCVQTGGQTGGRTDGRRCGVSRAQPSA